MHRGAITNVRITATALYPRALIRSRSPRLYACCLEGSFRLSHSIPPASHPDEQPDSNHSKLLLTETIHSRKRTFNLTEGAGAKLSFKWLDPTIPSSTSTQHLTASKQTSASRKLIATAESLIPHALQSWFRQTFLPIGFPDSVHPVYTRVHLFQFAETFLWSTVTVLCSQSMLESLGIASPAATGGAVAIQWVLKDQFGELGKLIFINRFAKSLDSHPKTWKFIGEISSLTGALLQLCTVLNPASFLLFASLGYTMRSIHFSIYNSTHMTFTRNFALQGNVGDIVAKDDSQQTVAHLLGLLTGVTLLTISHNPMFLFSVFFVIGPLHYLATIAFLNATQFEVLSSTKMLLLSDAYVRRDRQILQYREIEREGNTVWFGEWIQAGWSGVKVSKIGGSVNSLFKEVDAVAVSLDNENYLISYRKGKFGATFHQDATSTDVIQSILHITKLNQVLSETGGDLVASDPDNFKRALAQTLSWTRAELPQFLQGLEANKWLMDSVFWGDEGNRCHWERDGRNEGRPAQAFTLSDADEHNLMDIDRKGHKNGGITVQFGSSSEKFGNIFPVATLFVLFESASGYALFERIQSEEIGQELEEVQKAALDLAKFGRYIKLKSFAPFKSAAHALENIMDVTEGIVNDHLKSFLELNLPKPGKKNAAQLGVGEKTLAGQIKSILGYDCVSNETVTELIRGLRLHGDKMLRQLKEGDFYRAQLGLGHAYSRAKVKFNVNRSDNMIIQAINLLDQLDKDVNTFSMRVREWYGWHFPELVKVVNDNYQYARCCKLIGNKANLTEEALPELEAILNQDAIKAKQVISAANASMGTDLSEIDFTNIEAFADRVISLTEYRTRLHGYLVSKMHQVAPNLSALIGEMVGARLISHAGSLTNLCKYPASTVQILGAEKALFRALKTRGNTPKYGLIYHSTFIGRAATKNKGRISRILANKCSIASRIDCFLEKPTSKYGEVLKAQVEERLKFYEDGTTPRKNTDVMSGVVKELGDLDDEEVPAAEKRKSTDADGEKKKKKKKSKDADADEESEKPKKKKKKSKGDDDE
ncbi:snoRNP complex protein nop56 [Chytriomyces hyalinus]|nr:snoRNP complex protein nop56 [Chytriomyces hyalinus]